MASLWELWFGITVVSVMQNSTNKGFHSLSMALQIRVPDVLISSRVLRHLMIVFSLYSLWSPNSMDISIVITILVKRPSDVPGYE